MGNRRRWRLKGRHGLLVLLLFLLTWFIAWLFGRQPGSGGGGERGVEANASDRGDGRSGENGTPVLRHAANGETLADASGEGPAREPRPLRGPAHLTGRIQDANGNALAFAEVLVVRNLEGTAFPGLAPDPILARVRADENGRFFATIVPPEEGVVLLRPDEAPRPWVRSPRLRPEPWGAPVEVNLKRAAVPKTPLILDARWAPGWTTTPPQTIEVLARPAAGPTPLGPAPWCLDDKGRPPRVPEALPHLTLVPGQPTPLTFVGEGAWDLLIWAEGARAVTLTVEGSTASLPTIELAPLPTRSSGSEGSEAWWYLPDPQGLAATLWPADACELDPALRKRVVVLQVGDGPRALGTPSPSWANYAVEGDFGTWELRLVPAGLSVIEGEQFDFVTTALLGGWPEAGRVRAGSYRCEWIDGLTGRAVPGGGGIVNASPGTTLTVHPPPHPPSVRTIEGRVLDAENGRPVKGARILAGRGLATPPPVRLAPWARTDEQGRFALRGAPAGPLDLWVTAARHLPRCVTVTLGDDASATTAPTISLEPGPACTVTLAAGGAPDLRAVLVDRQGGTVEATFDGRGSALLPHVAPGPHVLLLAIGPFRAATEDWLDLRRIPGARAVEIPMDRATTVAWEPAAWSTGRLSIALVGKTPEAVTLEIVPDGTEALGGVAARLHREGVVDGDEITLVRWPPGRYLGVAHAGLASALVAFTLDPDGSAPVTLEFRFE